MLTCRSWFSNYEWSPQFCISNKLHSAAKAAILQAVLWTLRSYWTTLCFALEDDCYELGMPSHHHVPQNIFGNDTTLYLSQSIANAVRTHSELGVFFFFLISFLSGAMNKERPNYLCIQSVLQWFVNSQLWLMRLYWIKWLFSTSYCSVLACVCLCFQWTSIISRHFCQYYKMGWSFFVFYGVGLSS